jgi:integrase
LLYTGQRRSDIVQMGRQHIRDGILHLRQQKTGAPLAIPLHPALQAVLNATVSEHLTFLTTRGGSPFTPAGFTNWFREVCNEAGLPKGISAHGLRKAACRRLAEAGCSANVIAAISGHRSLNEVQRYTAAADQLRMARAGIEAMQEAFPAAIKRTSIYKPE